MKFHVIPFLILLLPIFCIGISACQDDPLQVNQDYPTVVSDLATSEANVSMLSATLVAHQTQSTRTPGDLDELASVQATAMTLRTEVEAQANTILAHQIAALSLTKLETDFETAVLLAIEANQLADTSTTRSSLLYALQHNPRLQNIIRFTDVGGVQDVAFNPDGRYLALAHGGGQLLLYDLFADRLIGELLPGLSKEFAGEGDGYPAVAFSPDGQFLVGTNPAYSSENENRIVIWDIATQQIVATSTLIALDAMFLSRENYLVTHDYEGVTVWDFSTGSLEEVSNLPLSEETWESRLSSMAAHPDGEIIALGYRDGRINLWNPFTNELSSLSSIIQAEYVYNLVFNPDGTILAISIPGQIILWDMVNNQAFGIISHNSSAVILKKVIN